MEILANILEVTILCGNLVKNNEGWPTLVEVQPCVLTNEPMVIATKQREEAKEAKTKNEKSFSHSLVPKNKSPKKIPKENL